MDRGGGERVVNRGAMRVGGTSPFDLLLRAGRGERREPGVDAGDRRAVPEAAVLRVATDDGLAWGAGVGGEREASGAVDAGNGFAGDTAGTAH